MMFVSRLKGLCAQSFGSDRPWQKRPSRIRRLPQQAPDAESPPTGPAFFALETNVPPRLLTLTEDLSRNCKDRPTRLSFQNVRPTRLHVRPAGGRRRIRGSPPRYRSTDRMLQCALHFAPAPQNQTCTPPTHSKISHGGQAHVGVNTL